MTEQVPFFQKQEETAPEKIDHRVFFSLVERAGSTGPYQKIMLIVLCILGYLVGGIMLITPYIFYQDPYKCEATPLGKTCLEYVCSLPLEQRAPFIQTPTIKSLATQYGDFRCEDQKFKLDSIISLFFLGKGVGPLVATLIGDLLGRKRLMLGNLLICAGGLLITIFSVDLVMAGVGLFLAMGGIQNAFNIEFYFITEKVSEISRTKYSVVIQLFFGIGVLLNVLWAFAVGDWKWILILFYLIPILIVILGIGLLIQDTPMCLVTKYSAEDALKSFKFISKLNKIQHFDLSAAEIAQIDNSYKTRLECEAHQKNKKFTFVDLFRYRSLLVTSVIGIILHVIMMYEFYAPALMIQQFKFNIFVNGLVIGVSELLAYPAAVYVISRYKRRITAYVCFAVTYVCSMILIFVWEQKDQKDENPNIGSSIGILALIFIFRYAITIQYTIFYVYMNQLYPTQVRVLGVGLLSMAGGFVITAIPESIDVCFEQNISIMALFAIMSGLSIYLSKFLHETFEVAPPDEIEQLREVDSKPLVPKHRMSNDELKRASLLSQDTSKEKATEQD